MILCKVSLSADAESWGEDNIRLKGLCISIFLLASQCRRRNLETSVRLKTPKREVRHARIRLNSRVDRELPTRSLGLLSASPTPDDQERKATARRAYALRTTAT